MRILSATKLFILERGDLCVIRATFDLSMKLNKVSIKKENKGEKYEKKRNKKQ